MKWIKPSPCSVKNSCWTDRFCLVESCCRVSRHEFDFAPLVDHHWWWCLAACVGRNQRGGSFTFLERRDVVGWLAHHSNHLVCFMNVLTPSFICVPQGMPFIPNVSSPKCLIYSSTQSATSLKLPQWWDNLITPVFPSTLAGQCVLLTVRYKWQAGQNYPSDGIDFLLSPYQFIFAQPNVVYLQTQF